MHKLTSMGAMLCYIVVVIVRMYAPASHLPLTKMTIHDFQRSARFVPFSFPAMRCYLARYGLRKGLRFANTRASPVEANAT